MGPVVFKSAARSCNLLPVREHRRIVENLASETLMPDLSDQTFVVFLSAELPRLR